MLVNEKPLIESTIWISPSDLSKWQYCPITLYYQKVEHRYRDKTTEGMVIGSFYHEFKRRMNRELKQISINDEQLAWFWSRRALSEARDTTILHHGEYPESIDNYFVKWMAEIDQEIEYYKKYPVIESEYSLSNKKLGLRGRVDAIVQGKNDEVMILDYKTGNDNNSYSRGCTQQMLAYLLLAQENDGNAWNFPVNRGILYYPESGKEKIIQLTKSNKEFLLKDVKEIQEMVSLSKEFKLEALNIAWKKWNEIVTFNHIENCSYCKWHLYSLSTKEGIHC